MADDDKKKPDLEKKDESGRRTRVNDEGEFSSTEITDRVPPPEEEKKKKD